jgi:hypothetical protein
MAAVVRGAHGRRASTCGPAAHASAGSDAHGHCNGLGVCGQPFVVTPLVKGRISGDDSIGTRAQRDQHVGDCAEIWRALAEPNAERALMEAGTRCGATARIAAFTRTGGTT